MANDILIVEDELDIARLLAESLEDDGYKVRYVHDGPGALEAISSRCPHLVLLDIWLGDSRFDGMRVLQELMKTYKDLPVVMMSGHGTIETAVSAMKQGAYDFIEKPFKMDRLLLVIQRALEAYKLRRENGLLRKNAARDAWVDGRCLIPNHVINIIERVAPVNSRVFIQGAFGTGKEAVAQAIHQASARQGHPFQSVYCGLPELDVMNELFGSETLEGRKVGVLEACHMGTVYLNDIGRLSLEVQNKLLRFLQEGVFTRQEGDKKVAVDVRILSSSTQDMATLVAQGLFREDLFYRLNVVPIKMPCLKERLADFEHMVKMLSDACCAHQGFVAKTFSDDAMIALKTHDWPGNIHQLKGVIEWTIVMNPQDTQVITAELLPAEVALQSPTVLHSDQAQEIMSLPLREARERFEKEYLLAQVSRFSGNISHTAHFVGMERSALHRKLKSLKIER